LKNFDDHISVQKQKKRAEDIKKQDLEDELANVRKQHTELVGQHGALAGEAEVSTSISSSSRLLHLRAIPGSSATDR
jgi:hypothetical protein